MKKVLVCGAGGFIGGHLVKHLRQEGCWVRGVDIKSHEYATSAADEFVLGDLREQGLRRSHRRPAVRRGVPARRRHGRRRIHLHRRARCRRDA